MNSPQTCAVTSGFVRRLTKRGNGNSQRIVNELARDDVSGVNILNINRIPLCTGQNGGSLLTPYVPIGTNRITLRAITCLDYRDERVTSILNYNIHIPMETARVSMATDELWPVSHQPVWPYRTGRSVNYEPGRGDTVPTAITINNIII